MKLTRGTIKPQHLVLGLALIGAILLKAWDNPRGQTESSVVQPAARRVPSVDASARRPVRTVEHSVSGGAESVPALTKRLPAEEGGLDVFGQPAPVLAAAPPVPPPLAVQRPPVFAPMVRAAPVASPALQSTSAPQPAFPYRVIGRYEVDGTAVVFLESPQGTQAATAGQLIDGRWKIDSISMHSMTLRYAPNDTVTTVSLLSLR